MEQIAQDKAVEQVSKLLDVTIDALESVPLKDGSGYRVYEPIRGGRSIIVANDTSFLFANSSVSPDVHEQAFAEGRRTDPSVF